MRLLLIPAFLVLSAYCGLAQSGAPPRFDVADVHPSGLAMNRFTFASGGVLRGDRFDLRKATMLDLIRIAWKIPPETVIGGPNWLEFDRFDIAAKAPAQTSPEAVRQMLQTLLADRFHLVVHRDTHPMPAYVLSTLKTTPKLTASSGAGESQCRASSQPDSPAVVNLSCRNTAMSAFALRLRNTAGDYIKEPVIDATGLEDGWDFDIQWTLRSVVPQTGAARTTIFDALEKQLGLKLELREAPAPVLVVDRVDKPTPNAPDVAQKLPPRPLQFEVATLKLNKTGQHGYPEYTRGGIRGTGLPLVTMMGFAWDMNTVHTRRRFIDLPNGADSVYFDVDARTAAHTNELASGNSGFDDDLRAMMRNLFVERFRIQWHEENRPMDEYSLLSAKPKMKKGDPAVRASCHEARSVADDPRDTNPLLTELVSCRNVTMAQFAAKLIEIDDFTFAYPAEDATGLKGTWDFDLSFTPGGRLQPGADGNAGDSGEPNGAISISEAISRHLGLKLVKRKRMLPAIVIDHMELTPTEN